MSLPISPGDAIAAITKAIEIWNKLRNAPEYIDNIGRRMEGLRTYLVSLKELLADKKRDGLATSYPELTQNIWNTVKYVELDVKKVTEILKRWDNDIGPFGWQLRYKSIAHALFAVRSSTDKLDALSISLEQYKSDLSHHLTLLGAISWNKFNTLQVAASIENIKTSKDPGAPLPSPSQAKKDFRVIFVDDYHGRSKIGAACMKAMLKSTKSAKKDCHVDSIHSAGFLVKRHSDCIDILQGFKAPAIGHFSEGLGSPTTSFVQFLCDELLGKPTSKTDSASKMTDFPSRGLKQDCFKRYDFILTFTCYQTEQLLRLKAVVEANMGKKAVKNEKGVILNLGAYLGGIGETVVIANPPFCTDIKEYRKRWDVTTSQIKSAVETFLQRELGWQVRKDV